MFSDSRSHRTLTAAAAVTALFLSHFVAACAPSAGTHPFQSLDALDPGTSWEGKTSVAAPPGLRNIVGGRRLAPSDVGSQSVVALFDSRQGGLCTGTLVAEDLVVTAGHCLLDGAMTHVVFGESVNARSAQARIIRSRGSLLKQQKDYPNNDVAWVRFKGPRPEGFAPARILDDATLLEPRQRLVLVGYGKTGDSRSARSGSRLTVSTVFGGLVDDAEFRNLLVVGPNAGKGNCFGDSGGPAFAEVNGEWVVVSALSGLEETLTPNLDCASGHTIHNLLGVHKEWISSSSGISLP